MDPLLSLNYLYLHVSLLPPSLVPDAEDNWLWGWSRIWSWVLHDIDDIRWLQAPCHSDFGVFSDPTLGAWPYIQHWHWPASHVTNLPRSWSWLMEKNSLSCLKMLDLSLISLAQFYSSTPNGTEEAKCGHLVRIIDWEHNMLTVTTTVSAKLWTKVLSIQIKSRSKNYTINYHLSLVPAQCLIIYRWNTLLINLCQVSKSDFCSLNINGFYILDSGEVQIWNQEQTFMIKDNVDNWHWTKQRCQCLSDNCDDSI